MKKTDQIAVHLSKEMKLQIMKLSEYEDKTPSQYVRDLIASHLADKKHDFMLLADVFDCDGTLRTDKTDNTQESGDLF